LKADEWKWGTIHKTYFTFVPWTEIPLLGRYWNRFIPASGNTQTLNVGIHSFQKKNFESFGSAIFRLVTDIDTTYYSVNTGTSDRVRSPFYDNFAEDFYDGKY
jgi:acyl-homoserine lactone acylase PvdQ